MSIVIGIKYCGGCNPGYNRGKIAELLKEDFPEVTFLAATAQTSYDIVVFIKGCLRPCVREEDYSARFGKFSVTSDKDYAALKEMITTIKKEEAHELER